MDDFADLDAAAARLPWLDDVLAARRAAEVAPLPEPSIIPEPTHVGEGMSLFFCPLGCGWFHAEHPGREQLGPIVVPVDYTSADISAALTAQAVARGEAMRARVEAAVTEHFGSAHPGR